MADHRLDPHAQAILEEYRAQRPVFEKMQETIPGRVRALLDEAGIVVASVESRIKEEGSLAGKLELKGGKYASLADITDIFGMRIITFYTDDVDKVASAVDRLFEVDWENSVDKRKLLEVDSFGYLSLHYICKDPAFPYRFEVQMRTILQHAWANMNHDTGYKTGVEVPTEYLRNMNRLAGMLELVDEQFSRIRTEINDYRRQVQSLVVSGRLEEVPLDGDSYRSFLQLGPFDPLNRRIASVNQAEIQDVTLMPFLAVFKALGLKTLGDVEGLIKKYGEAAYQILTRSTARPRATTRWRSTSWPRPKTFHSCIARIDDGETVGYVIAGPGDPFRRRGPFRGGTAGKRIPVHRPSDGGDGHCRHDDA